jgi:hypothetical protein
MTPLKIQMPKPNKELRPDFDYSCECGFYVCDACGYSIYPMELHGDGSNYDPCPNCELGGDMVKYETKDKRKVKPEISPKLKEIWERLGDTPVNDDMELECAFDGGLLGQYAVGQNVEDIWHDIEVAFDISIGDAFFK